ncbi:MAG: response regulator [Bacteroidales bacterium]|nr:response regulator [Bacteroidales bacterium]
MKSEMPHPVFNWKGKRILIVEDDYVNYLYFHEILSGANACLIRAVSLKEAFDMITSVIRFDLLIINTSLPGNENCRSIKRMKMLWPDIRIIAIAGCDCNGRNRNCYQAGCDTLINQHIDCNEMMSVVDELFSSLA